MIKSDLVLFYRTCREDMLLLFRTLHATMRACTYVQGLNVMTIEVI